MYSPTHAALGATLALIAPDPVTAFAAGVVSHYVLDSFPHGDAEFGRWLRRKDTGRRMTFVEIIDLGLAIAVTWFFVAHRPDAAVRIIAGAFGAILPDLTWGFRLVTQRLGWKKGAIPNALNIHQYWHEALHIKAKNDVSFLVGLEIQAVIVAVLILTNR